MDLKSTATRFSLPSTGFQLTTDGANASSNSALTVEGLQGEGT
jgi:hypothetical protein